MGVVATKPHPINYVADRAPLLKFLEITIGFSCIVMVLFLIARYKKHMIMNDLADLLKSSNSEVGQ